MKQKILNWMIILLGIISTPLAFTGEINSNLLPFISIILGLSLIYTKKENKLIKSGSLIAVFIPIILIIISSIVFLIRVNIEDNFVFWNRLLEISNILTLTVGEISLLLGLLLIFIGLIKNQQTPLANT